MNWNVRNAKGETPIMLALKNKEREMVKILLKNPRVDRGEILKTKEGMEILTEMLQETDEENIASKVPECPVRICCINTYLFDEYLFPGLSQ